MINYELVIIGGGAAGMSAAISAYDKGIKNILLIEKDTHLGGILNQCIHQGFGLHYFKEEMSGPNYAYKLYEILKEKEEIEVLCESFVMDITKDKTLLVSTPNEKMWVSASAIIFATGSYERTSSMINLPSQRLNGIYNAGVAQKYINEYGLNVGKKVFILGSGDIGLIMARRMVLEGSEVLGVAEIMPYSNGLSRNIVTCLNDFDIPLYLSHTVVNTKGVDGNLQSVTIAKLDDNRNIIKGSEKEFEVDTLLLAVGLIPVTELMDKLNLKKDNRTKSVFVDSTYQTSIDGIFVCGNSLHVHDLVDYVSKESNLVGEYAAKYIKEEIKESDHVIGVSNDDNIGYTIPQSIDLNNTDKTIELYFRSRRPFTDCKLQVHVDNKLVREVKKSIILPAEMQSIKIKTDSLNDKSQEIKVSIKEVYE